MPGYNNTNRQEDKCQNIYFLTGSRRFQRDNSRFYNSKHWLLFLNFSSGNLKLTGNLTVYLVSQTHVILQTFLFGTNTLQNDIVMGVHIVGVFLLSDIIFLLTFLQPINA